MDSEITGKSKEEETGGQMTFFEHLIELRKRIINSLLAIAVCAAGGWFLAPKVVAIISVPIQAVLKAHGYNAQLYYTGPTDYLGLLVKLSIYIGLVLSSPVVLYQVWMFVAPALYKHERSAVTGFVFSTVFLFRNRFRIFSCPAAHPWIPSWLPRTCGSADSNQRLL
jgi:sec-independent protein translocase protein TatC